MPDAPPLFRPAWRKPAERPKEQRAPRGTRSERGYTNDWFRARHVFLQDHPLCAYCDAEGRATPADVVDHVIPHRGDQDLFWDRRNWQALCKTHHDQKSRAERSSGLLYPQGLRPSAIPLTIVAGPPGAGKTTYAQQIADRVIDLDLIVAGLAGEMYPEDRRYLPAALERRNSALMGLARATKGEAAFVICAPSFVERRWWKESLGGKVIVLDTALDVCIRRIEADERRLDRGAHIARARRWWRDYSAG
jgi:hypothetical protein